jgi:uncharacterized RDD family membrane protein YckC
MQSSDLGPEDALVRDDSSIASVFTRVWDEIESGQYEQALKSLEQEFQESKKRSEIDSLREVERLAQRLRSRTSGRINREATHLAYAASQNVRLLERKAALGVDRAFPQLGEGDSSIVLAGWFRRVLALMIDLLIVWVVPVTCLTLGLAAGGSNLEDDSVGAAVLFLAVLALTLLWPLYFALFHAFGGGRTPGKRALGITVRDITGAKIGVGRAFGRAFFFLLLYFLGGIGLLIDGLWPLWDRRNQALHDKVVDTIVIRTGLKGT